MEGTQEAATDKPKRLLREPHHVCPVWKAGTNFCEELSVYSSHSSCVWLTGERLGDAVREAQSTSAGESELNMGHRKCDPVPERRAGKSM